MLLAQYLYKKTHKGFIPLKCFCLNNERELDVMAIKEAAEIVYITVVWTHDSAREFSLHVTETAKISNQLQNFTFEIN